MKTKKYDAIVLSSLTEQEAFAQFTQCLKASPLPDDEILANLGIFLTSKNLARILFFYNIYMKILQQHGIIIEFGVRWGQTMSLMSALRGIFEPFNRHRKIVGFDTFEGFKGIGQKDGNICHCKDGSFSVAADYEKYLGDILSLQEKLNPMPHIKKFELVKGDAQETVTEYFKRHPETIVSLAIFDFDIYAPTKAALEAVIPHLCKGSVLVFDELSDDIFPGETLALMETIGLKNVNIKRYPYASRISYLEIE